MRLEVRMQLGLLRTTSVPPRIDIESAQPRIEMHTRFPQVRLTIEQPAVELDLTAPLDDIGLKRFHSLAKEIAAAGRRDALTGIARIAETGDRLAAVEKGESVPAVSAEQAWPPPPETNVDAIPKHMVQVEVRGGVEIDHVPGEIVVEPRLVAVRTYSRGGYVETTLARKPVIDFGFVDDSSGNRPFAGPISTFSTTA